MRQLSKRTQYSLRALYALARKYGAGPVLITQLAEEELIPKKFLEQILLSLKTLGFDAHKEISDSISSTLLDRRRGRLRAAASGSATGSRYFFGCFLISCKR